MVARYKFLFVRDYKNNHDQVTIPRGTSGILSFEDFKVHLQCFRIIPQQGTHILTIKYDYIKPCVVLKELGVQVNLEVKETERCEEKTQSWTFRKKKISGFHLCSS
jgi:hypothetical protein